MQARERGIRPLPAPGEDALAPHLLGHGYPHDAHDGERAREVVEHVDDSHRSLLHRGGDLHGNAVAEPVRLPAHREGA